MESNKKFKTQHVKKQRNQVDRNEVWMKRKEKVIQEYNNLIDT